MKRQNDIASSLIDSTIIENGKALFSGEIEQPEVYGIFFENQPQGIFPIVEKGIIKIRIDNDDLKNAYVTGTPLNNQLNSYKNNLKSISSKMNNLFHDFQRARAENNSDRITEINEKMNYIHKEMTDYKINFIKNNPTSFVASMVLFSLANENIVEHKIIEGLYLQLSKEVQQSTFSSKIQEILYAKTNQN